MTNKPIIFSAPMVRAILDGRKTQTRRIMPHHDAILRHASAFSPIVTRNAVFNYAGDEEISRAPYSAGDRLWVRETWRDVLNTYGAGYAPGYKATCCQAQIYKWRPSIHMPRWASRLTLEVTAVRVERLQEISADDAREEGLDWVAPTWGIPGIAESWRDNPFAAFFALWDHINGPGAAAANPWVVAVSFSPCTGEVR